MPKGPFVADAEAQSVALRDALVQDANAVGDAVGDVPFGAVELDAHAEAVKWLPLWFTLGQADDLISVPWWELVLKTQGPAAVAGTNPSSSLPKGKGFDRDMRAYWANEDWRREAFLSAPPELIDYLHFLISVGLHAGQPRPQAKDSPADAPQRASGGRAPVSGTPTGSYA
jgi:hypothetical protein